MTLLAFDTHKFIKDLSSAGMNIEQAEVLADHYTNLLTDRIATKEDVALLRKDMAHLKQDLEVKIVSGEERLEGKMVSLEERLEGKIESSSKDLLIKMLVSQIGIAGLIIAILSYTG